ncbi:MAG: hypothetical protein LC754_01475 [Acidobacteria bacterium]|nr:hypothetical protein [Acidobacteriota bacterium]
MDETFAAIGLEVPSEKDFNYLAERAGDHGEPTQLSRRGAVLHGRCWKLGEGLEVWTVLYESGTGEVFYADCRPGFRARYTQRITPWALTEYDEDGEAIVHGFCDGTETEVLFELQNLTEVGPEGFRAQELQVGLCGLAYRARVSKTKPEHMRWEPLEKAAPSRAAHENDWSLTGRVLSFKSLRNPLSGSELHWVYLDLEQLRLEVLVNRRALRGGALALGATLSAEVWLQGHILDRRALLSRYEGADTSCSMADLWTHLKRRN